LDGSQRDVGGEEVGEKSGRTDKLDARELR